MHLSVARWATPEQFLRWKKFGLSIGLVESGPLVRSNYHADEQSQKYIGPAHHELRERSDCGVTVVSGKTAEKRAKIGGNRMIDFDRVLPNPIRMSVR